jgi:hypothetical protein
MGGLFDEIRAASAHVMERARFVTISSDRLEAVAAELVDAAQEPALLDPAHHHLSAPESTVAFVVTLDAVNFGSGWFPHLAKRPGCSGYFTIAGSLRDHFDAHGPFGAKELMRLGPTDCAALFGQDPSPSPAFELMTLYARALFDLGRLLDGRYGGSFVRLVESADHCAEELVRALAEMPLYRDVATYAGRPIPFYKRAQLTCADLATALDGEGWGSFRDLDRLTCFADNLVPHVLRMEGVLEYDEELLDRIEREELIAPNSLEEVEIRAAAVHVVERMCDVMNRSGRTVTPQRLDYLLWNRGQSPSIKAEPRHRARSVFY